MESRNGSASLLLVENISSAGACATSILIAHAARTLHNKTWGRSIKTVQPCRAGWPSAAQHWGCLWAGSGCWELRVSRSCPLIDDTICGSLPVRALNFGWRETKASCVPVWSLCSTVPVGVVLVGGGAAGPGGDHRLHTAGFSRALDLELASCRGICISRINKEQQKKKNLRGSFSLTQCNLFPLHLSFWSRSGAVNTHLLFWCYLFLLAYFFFLAN